ncbi:anti-sigma regulatory factor [Bacillus solimangrovi]|uniref:Serine/threonine protein kinase n=1 Tax=Bacillus solimangrovi TaxID=1305675 RepID=A0A1E5LG65_9BACI|nr:anti-sigma regulatory factor [Bacillus solimangrovi]OEH93070.1 serine/threonine protein kinase [Bacillus solimangrovi]
MSHQSCVNIQKEWDIVAARQLGRNIAKELGFGNVDQARITTAISELARNIYLYTRGGNICYEIVNQPCKKGLMVVASDNGPGIKEIKRVMEDGYSTSGGLGAGLPGVKRLMDDFSIESDIGVGTKIIVYKWLRR